MAQIHVPFNKHNLTTIMWSTLILILWDALQHQTTYNVFGNLGGNMNLNMISTNSKLAKLITTTHTHMQSL